MKSRLSDDGKIVAISRQKKALSVILNDAKEMRKIYKSNDHPVPTELKLVYNYRTGQFKADYRYDVVVSDTKTDHSVSEAWFKQLAERD